MKLRRPLLPWRPLAALMVVLCTILTRIPAHAQQTQPVFEPGLEGEIWKSQPPDKIGRIVQPPCLVWRWNEEMGDYEADSACSGAELWAQEEAQGRHDQLLFPAGVGVYEPTPRALANGFPATRRILVADRYNHRVLVFLAGPNGTWRPLDQVVPADVDAANWNGFPMPNAPWPDQFDGLSYPEDLAVDRAGFVWVANLGKCRIDVFTAAGQFQTGISLSEVCDYWGANGLFPYGVAVNDEAEYGGGGRIAIIAQDYAAQASQVIVLNAADGTVIGRHAPDPFAGQLDDPGALNLATGIDYHRANGVDRLVVADTENNRVQVFATESETEPNPGAPKPVPVLIFGSNELQLPYSLHVDARGRVLVSDSAGSRETFFTVDFSGTPSASFLYELNARGGLNGFPGGVAEDSDHRLYIVDTSNHEVEVFEIPELAVVGVEMTPLTPRANDTVTFDFSVIVPETRSMMPNVTATCGVASGTVELLRGPLPIDGTPAGAVDISPAPAGAVYRYRCEFLAVESGPFTLQAGAQGGPLGTEVTAPIKVAAGTTVDCGGACESDSPEIFAAVTAPVAVNGFYPGDATVTLTATDPESGDAGASGIKRIYWKWVASSAMSNEPVDPALACPDEPAPTQCVEFAAAVPARVATVIVMREGANTLEFWTQDFHGTSSQRRRIAVVVDKTAPNWTMSAPPVPNSGWFNTDVSIELMFSDSLGLTPPSQIVTTPRHMHRFLFSHEGRGVTQTVNVEDLAGNTWPEPLVSPAINLDKTAPQTTAAAALGLLANSQMFLPSSPPVFDLTAVDPMLGDGSEGSGVTDTFFHLDAGPVQQFIPGVSTITTTALGPHALKYWSKDLAGNHETPVTRTFYVNAPPVAAADSASARDGLAVTVNVLANDADDNDRASDPLTVSIATPSPNGTAVVNANNTITFTPERSFSGVTTFVYRLSDAHGGSSNATVTVTVTATSSNRAPTAVYDFAQTNEDTVVDIDVVANDIDPDTGDSLSIDPASVAPPPSTTGTVAIIGTQLRFTPAADYSGLALFTYKVRDASGAASATAAAVLVRIRPVDDHPVAAPDAASVSYGQAIELSVVANDSDADGDTLSVTAFTQPSVGSVVRVSATVLRYVPPAAGAAAATAAFKYTLSDGAGPTATGTVTVTVRPPIGNQPPLCGAAAAAPSEVWPPNQRPAAVTITGVTDPERHAITIRVTKILQDEPTDSSSDGETTIDAGGIGTASAWVRAERMGRENGRIYDIFFTATDSKGAACSGTVRVGVPHDQRRDAVDSGCRWDSTKKKGAVLSCAPGAAPPRPRDDDHDGDHNGHHAGDNCDHERGRKGHQAGDGCDHDRTDHDEQRGSHRDGDDCDEDRDHRRYRR